MQTQPDSLQDITLSVSYFHAFFCQHSI